jgi:hypothetical protein
VTNSTPRTVEYFVLRACERFGMRPAEFEGLSYDEQVRLLAYDQVRREESGA